MKFQANKAIFESPTMPYILIAIGRNGLYTVKASDIPTSTSTISAFPAIPTSEINSLADTLLYWHKRLGHLKI